MEDTKTFEEISGSIEDYIETRELTSEEQERLNNVMSDYDDYDWMRQKYERQAEYDYINQFVSLAKKGDVVGAIREIAKELYNLKQNKADREIILVGC